MKKTRIVATVGPATQGYEQIVRLIEGGVDVFRLNFSHGSHENHGELIERIRQAARESGRPVAILQDISGPKMRIGDLAKPLELEPGDRLELVKDAALIEEPHQLSLTDPEALEDLQPGAAVYFADGTIRTRVSGCDERAVHLEVLTPGTLSSRKGVNFPGVRLRISAITPKDRSDIAFGAKMGVDMVAISFVQSAEDMRQARSLLHAAASRALLLAKIEKHEAVEELEAILAESDGLMVARGDLGVEVGLEKVPVIQKKVIAAANAQGKPVITATQMLGSMVHSPFPTRAEISDIANAVLDGTDAVMLSDETAVGAHPLKAVAVLCETIREIESIYPYGRHTDRALGTGEAVAASVAQLSCNVGAEGVIVFSFSGQTAYKMAKFRPKSRLLCVTHDEAAFRRLGLCWGAEHTFTMPVFEDNHALMRDFIKEAAARGLIAVDKTYIAVMGYPAGTPGQANVIRLITPENIAMLLGEG